MLPLGALDRSSKNKSTVLRKSMKFSKYMSKKTNLSCLESMNIRWFIAHLETSILCQAKTISHSSYRMSSICVTSNILICALDSNLQSCTTIGKHLPQVRSKAIIWPPDGLKKSKRQQFIFIKEMRHSKFLGSTTQVFIFTITMIHKHFDTHKINN